MKLFCTTTQGQAPVRRWVAALLLSLFVLSGFLHSITHVDAGTSAASLSSVQMVAGGDTADDDGQPGTLDVAHCHGCAAASLPEVGQVDPSSDISGALISLLSGILTPSQRQFDTPPPKALA
jgi:hypothetical protein